MDKYYTPTKDEFYEGFLYEYNGSKDLELWALMSHSYKIAELFPEGAFSGSKVRVKKLSLGCVKELGFDLTRIPGDSMDWEWHIEKDSITYGTATEDEGVIDELELFGCIFHVKNKSELKVLLRQLNIDIDERA